MDNETRERVKSNPVYRVLRWTVPWIALAGLLFFANGLWTEYQTAAKSAPSSFETSSVLEPSVGSTMSASAVTLIAGLNLREAPDTDSKVIVKLEKGASLAVYELRNGWYRVKIPDAEGEGWISANKQYVKLEEAEK